MFDNFIAFSEKGSNFFLFFAKNKKITKIGTHVTVHKNFFFIKIIAVLRCKMIYVDIYYYIQSHFSPKLWQKNYIVFAIFGKQDYYYVKTILHI